MKSVLLGQQKIKLGNELHFMENITEIWQYTRAVHKETKLLK
jgi:hypothetical protein